MPVAGRNGVIDMDLEQVSHLLPPVVAEIVELIGYADAQKLIERLGGTSFLVSKQMRHARSWRSDLLAKTVSREAARKLVGRFGGEELYIPRCDSALREWRNRHFVAEYQAMLDAGESGRQALSTLCPRYKISDRQGKNILIKFRGQDTQLDLF